MTVEARHSATVRCKDILTQHTAEWKVQHWCRTV